MNSYDTDQARELRRARLVTIRPTNAPDIMTQEAFETEYRKFHVLVRECMPDAEEHFNVMFCPACQETAQFDDSMVMARKLHATYEQDPLRNYRALVTVSCKGCGWSEIIPISGPGEAPADAQRTINENLMQEQREKMNEMRNVSGISNSMLGQSNAGMLNAQAVNAEMMRQYQKQSMLATMYGAGPNALKNMKSLITRPMLGIGMDLAAQAKESAPATRGQGLADKIWGEYEEHARLLRDAESAKRAIEHRSIRQQMIDQMAKEMTKKIDEDVLASLAKKGPPDKIVIAKRPKYAVSPPSAPKLSDIDYSSAEMRVMVDAALKEPDPAKKQSLIARIMEHFR